jgi:predicted GNAT superfamily acetyltransferase
MSDDNPMGTAASGDAPAHQDASDLKREVEQEESQLSVYIPESIHKRLRVRSAETGRPMKDLTAEALDEFLE